MADTASLQQELEEARELVQALQLQSNQQLQEVAIWKAKTDEARAKNAQLMREKEQLRGELARALAGGGSSASTIRSSTSPDNELARVREERDQLARALSELEVTMKDIHASVQQLTEEKDQMAAKHAAEIERLRSIIKSLDEERDRFQQEVDEKAEQIAELKEKLSAKNTSTISVEREMDELKRQRALHDEQLSNKDREIINLRAQVERYTAEIEILSARCRTLTEELTVHAHDEGNLARETSILHHQLAQAASERDSLRNDLHEHKKQVLYLTQLLKVKEKEKEDILASYRTLNEEKSQVSGTAQLLQSERDTFKIEIANRDQELARLTVALHQSQEERKALLIDLEAYERQNSELSRTILRLEERIQSLDHDNAQLTRALDGSRDAHYTLLQTHEALQNELASATKDKSHLQALYEDTLHQLEQLRQQLADERVLAKQLEELLAAEREREAGKMARETELAAEAVRVKEQWHIERHKALTARREIKALVERQGELEGELRGIRHELAVAGAEKDALLAQQRELQQSNAELMAKVDHQLAIIKELDEERLRLKRYSVKYETELLKAEQRIAELSAVKR